MKENKQLVGILSMIGTIVLLALIAWKTEAFKTVLNELALLTSGNYREIAHNGTNLLTMFPVIFAVVTIDLPCCMLAIILQEAILGKTSKKAIADIFEKMEEGNHFFTFFIVVLAEELFARGLFLGLLTKIPLLSGTGAFYALALIGNGAWALLHLSNFKRKKDRSVLRTLPQFVGGIFLTYIFVKYGLLAAILAHFAFNAVIFAGHKIQRTSSVDGLIIGYSAMCGIASFMLMKKPLADIVPWFSAHSDFRLPGWTFWDYVKLSVFVSACFSLLFDALLYDRGEAGKKGRKLSLETFVIGVPLLIGAIYGTYWLLGLFIENVPYRVLVLAILLTSLHSGASGSAVARSFWCSLPMAYFIICILQALGFWPSMWWLLIAIVIQTPIRILNEHDD